MVLLMSLFNFSGNYEEVNCRELQVYRVYLCIERSRDKSYPCEDLEILGDQ